MKKISSLFTPFLLSFWFFFDFLWIFSFCFSRKPFPRRTVILEPKAKNPLRLKTNRLLVGKLFKAQRLGRARIAPRRTGKRACAPQALFPFIHTLFFIPIISIIIIIRRKLACIIPCIRYVHLNSTRLILPIIEIIRSIPSGRILKDDSR